MERAALVPLALVILGICAEAQRPSSRQKETPPDGSGEPFPGDQPTEQGFAPDRVQLGDPIQPTEIQVRQGGAITADPRAKLRTVVRILVNYERGHRDRVARLERLRGLFEAAGASDKVREVQRLSELEMARFTGAQRGYERDLGPAIYAQVRALLEANGGAPPTGAAANVPPAGKVPPPGKVPPAGKVPPPGKVPPAGKVPPPDNIPPPDKVPPPDNIPPAGDLPPASNVPPASKGSTEKPAPKTPR